MENGLRFSMNNYTIKTSTATQLLGLLISMMYGVFITLSLQRNYFLGRGDINALVDFFDNIDLFLIFNNYTIMGDGLFRIGIVFLGNYFNSEYITILSYLGFIMSSTVFCIYSLKIRSSKYLVYILPLFIMVFFTPMVSALFASGIRSGIAFTILMVAMIYTKGLIKYILFGLSGLMHLSMIPIMCLYILFNMLSKVKITSSFVVRLSVLAIFAALVAQGAKLYQFNDTIVSSSVLFNLLIVFVGFMIIFTNKKAINNIYGFIAVGLMLIYIFGIIIDVSFIRYVGNSIILYLFFLIYKGEVGTIQVFTTGYTPFFVLTLFYSIANYA